MERELFRIVKAELGKVGPQPRGRNLFSDVVIVTVYFWAVIHDRPISWACRPVSWTGRERPRRLPSQSRMSRRLRSQSVLALIGLLEERVLRCGRTSPTACAVDGKALPVGSHSHDRHARWGRGAGVWAKGYKLHMLLSLCGTVMAWRVAQMSVNEREMGRRLLAQAQFAGYIFGDKQYDANYLYAEAAAHGGQLVAPRQMGQTRGLGRRRQATGRLRSKDLLENTVSPFGRELHEMRDAIERKFGYLTCTSGLLNGLPSWTRTYPRVRLWVQAKIILADLRTRLMQTTRAV